MPRTALIPSLLAAGALVLTAGCTASANYTVSPESLAEQVAQNLQELVGTDAPPTIDCGDESIDIVEGEVVTCDLTEDGSSDVYPVTVTITGVDGTDYTINFQVADEPR